jgi:hypothetical protein
MNQATGRIPRVASESLPIPNLTTWSLRPQPPGTSIHGGIVAKPEFRKCASVCDDRLECHPPLKPGLRARRTSFSARSAHGRNDRNRVAVIAAVIAASSVSVAPANIALAAAQPTGVAMVAP